MAPSVRVNSHKKVVLTKTNPDYCIQISTFEITIKKGFLLFFKGRIHTPKESIVFGLEVVVKLAKVGSQMGEVGIDE
jgi:hypothetical protein